MTISHTHTRTITDREIRNPRVLELYGLWSACREPGQPPREAALLPEAFALCKDDLLLLTPGPGGVLSHAHVGANVAAQIGVDWTGAPVDAAGGALGRFYRDWCRRALEEGEAIYTVHTEKTPQGRKASWERLLLPLKGPDGAVDRLLALHAPMRMRLEILTGVIETSHCGVMALEAIRNAAGRIIDFRIALANPQAAAILNGARDALLDQRLLRVFPQVRDAGLSHSLAAVADGAAPTDITFQLGDRWLRITAARTGVGVTLTLSDITVFKRQNEELQREIARRTEVEYELIRLATVDALTGLPNRRHFLDRAERELNRAQRRDIPLSVIYLDIDHFKAVNDRFGHGVGDAVLQTVAGALNGSLRPYDVVGRLGGEEFAVLLPNAALEAAKTVSQRILERVRTQETPTGDGDPVRVTISGGVAQFRPDESIEAALARADAALYEAKRGGRDQMVEAA